MTPPFYLLVVMYAVVKLFLHVMELFIGSVSSYVTVSLVTRIPAVLLRYAMCLSDIHQRRPELLQLTAGYTH